MDVSKNRGKTPKMDGENKGSNPMNKWMIWGVPLFLETPIYVFFVSVVYIHICRYMYIILKYCILKNRCVAIFLSMSMFNVLLCFYKFQKIAFKQL